MKKTLALQNKFDILGELPDELVKEVFKFLREIEREEKEGGGALTHRESILQIRGVSNYYRSLVDDMLVETFHKCTAIDFSGLPKKSLVLLAFEWLGNTEISFESTLSLHEEKYGDQIDAFDRLIQELESARPFNAISRCTGNAMKGTFFTMLGLVLLGAVSVFLYLFIKPDPILKNSCNLTNATHNSSARNSTNSSQNCKGIGPNDDVTVMDYLGVISLSSGIFLFGVLSLIKSYRVCKKGVRLPAQFSSKNSLNDSEQKKMRFENGRATISDLLMRLSRGRDGNVPIEERPLLDVNGLDF